MIAIEQGSLKFGQVLKSVLRRVKGEKTIPASDGKPASVPHSSVVFSEMCGVDARVIRAMENGLAFRYGHGQVRAVLTAMLPYVESDTTLVDLWLFDTSMSRQEALAGHRDCGREIELSASLISGDAGVKPVPDMESTVAPSDVMPLVAELAQARRPWRRLPRERA